MDTLSTFNFILSTQTGVTCGPRYPLIRPQALATGPVSAAIANANATRHNGTMTAKRNDAKHNDPMTAKHND